MYAADGRWWRVYGTRAYARCSGEFWAAHDKDGGQSGEWSRVPPSVRAKVHEIEIVEEEGLSTNPRRINGGGHSGYQAIGLAALWGAARIVLLGYDMQRTGGKAHHHGNHEGGLPNLGKLDSWVRRMIPMGRDLRERGVPVINATRETALRCFERMPIEEALRV